MSSHHLSSPAEIADQPASSSRGLSRGALLRGALGAAGLVLLEGALPGGVRTASAAVTSGPSTTVMPYLLPSRVGVDITALLKGVCRVSGLGAEPLRDRFEVRRVELPFNLEGFAANHCAPLSARSARLGAHHRERISWSGYGRPDSRAKLFARRRSPQVQLTAYRHSTRAGSSVSAVIRATEGSTTSPARSITIECSPAARAGS